MIRHPTALHRSRPLAERWAVLAVCSVILLLAAVLHPHAQGGVALPWSTRALPSVCGFQAATGLPCAGCGLTRCFVRLMRGQWRAAVAEHPLGPLVFGWTVAQIPWQGLQIWRVRRGKEPNRSDRAMGWLLPILVALLYTRWLVEGAMGMW